MAVITELKIISKEKERKKTFLTNLPEISNVIKVKSVPRSQLPFKNVLSNTYQVKRVVPLYAYGAGCLPGLSRVQIKLSPATGFEC